MSQFDEKPREWLHQIDHGNAHIELVQVIEKSAFEKQAAKIAEFEEQIESLIGTPGDYAELVEISKSQKKILLELEEANNQLAEKLRVAVEALEFYADEKKMVDVCISRPAFDGDPYAWEYIDDGEIARQALEKLKGAK